MFQVLTACLQAKLPDAFSLDPKQFDHVLNVVTIDGKLQWAVHKADHTYRQTVLLTQPSHREVSSAAHKLHEALEVAGCRLSPGQTAIDLGKTTGFLLKQWLLCTQMDRRQVCSSFQQFKRLQHELLHLVTPTPELDI